MWPHTFSSDYDQYNLGAPINNVLSSVPGRINVTLDAVRYGMIQLDRDLHSSGTTPPHLTEALEHLRAIEGDLVSASNHYHEAVRNLNLR